MEKRHFEWLPVLASGDSVIDAQTKEFLTKVNDFIDTLDSDYRFESLDKVLAFLLDYSRKHFSVQEEMMKRINYPALNEHTTEHKIFLRRISKLYKQLLIQKNPHAPKDEDYDDRGLDGVISDTYDTIISWHDNHMSGTDKRLADFYMYEYKN